MELMQFKWAMIDLLLALYPTDKVHRIHDTLILDFDNDNNQEAISQAVQS